MTLGQAVIKRITEYSNQRNITFNKVSVQAGIAHTLLYDLTAGRTKVPRLDTVYNLCLGLGIPLSEFFASPLFDEENIDS